MTMTRRIIGSGVGSLRAAAEAGKRIRMQMRNLLTDRNGVGGVEFAIVAPMLLVLYLMSFELTMGLSVAKKTSMAAGTVADLVARQEQIDQAFLLTMTDVTKAMFVPYPSKDLLIKVSAIKIDDRGNAAIVWSWSTTGVPPYSKGSKVTVPADMMVKETFLVHSELSVSHELMVYLPGFSGIDTKTMTIEREFYFRQRLGTAVTCTDC